MTQGEGSKAMDRHPPRPALCWTVGITGHRREALNGGGERIRRRIDAVLLDIAAAVDRVAAGHAASFAPGKPRLQLISPLAAGADLIAAQAAHEHGIGVIALLPFARDEYLEDFEHHEDRAAFLHSLDRASRILELPGQRARALNAYVMAGRATVAHSDILIAVWDGKPARGRGGTGEVIDHALRRGKPVIHVPADGSADDEVRLLWGGFAPQLRASQLHSIPARPYDAGALGALIQERLAPPLGGEEQKHLDAYYAERQPRLRVRIEYPLLLALTGVKRMASSTWRIAPFAETARLEWAQYGAALHDGTPRLAADLSELEGAYGWADGLATHYAQGYRSGHILNFALAAAAVVLGVAGLLAPPLKLLFTTLELLAIGTVVVNTHTGLKQQWHRRWLDYRQLAERLRALRGLDLMVLADEPPDPSSRTRWIDWYTAACWRMLDLPQGRLAPEAVRSLAPLALECEITPQADYHRRNAAVLHKLDHRLHTAGDFLFVATIASCLAFIVAYFAAHDWATAHSPVFIFLSASLPALGTALFGIRFQGDFIGAAERSRSTAAQLDALAAHFESSAHDLMHTADLAEAAARAMQADLADWRVSYAQRKLAIPA